MREGDANLLTGLGIDEVFQRTDQWGTRLVLPDGLGSTLALVDSAGTLQTQYTYEPFGKTTVSGATSINSFQYTGREERRPRTVNVPGQPLTGSMLTTSQTAPSRGLWTNLRG